MVGAFQTILAAALRVGVVFDVDWDCPQSILVGFSSYDGLAEITRHVSGSASGSPTGVLGDTPPSNIKVSTFTRPMPTLVWDGHVSTIASISVT